MGNRSSNLQFYKNELAPEPFKMTFGEIIEFWSGNYERLHKNDNYIHWLFPNKSYGNNRYAYAITDNEIKEIKNDPILMHRFLTAFDMMLEFWGMRRKDIHFELSPDSDERLRYLNNYSKNYFRITRILTSLRLFGLHEIWENWMNFLLILIENGSLNNANASYTEYWLKTVNAE